MTADDPSAAGAMIAARLTGMAAAVEARLGETMDQVSLSLYERVQALLHGEAVQSRSGRLAGSVARVVERVGGRLSAGLTVDGDAAPYAAALEFGASLRARLIEARNAKALAFVVAGRQRFARRVQFPGARIAPRAFMQKALMEMAPAAAEAIAATVAAATAP